MKPTQEEDELVLKVNILPTLFKKSLGQGYNTNPYPCLKLRKPPIFNNFYLMRNF